VLGLWLPNRKEELAQVFFSLSRGIAPAPVSQMRSRTVKNQGGSQEMTNILDERLTVHKPNKKFPGFTISQLRLSMGKYKIQDDQLIPLHKKGLTDRELAEALNVSKHTIFERRKKLGLQPNLKSFESAVP